MTELKMKPGRIKAKVTMGATKIHRANSPQVLSGEVPEGFTENVPFLEGQGEQMTELNYQQCVEMFGQEWADERWAHLTHEEASDG